jgi:hypothetical protein
MGEVSGGHLVSFQGGEEVKILGDFSVPVTQYISPNGRMKTHEVSVSPEAHALWERHSDDISLSAEVLRTGDVAVYARFRSRPEEEELIDVVPRGGSARDALSSLIVKLANGAGE